VIFAEWLQNKHEQMYGPPPQIPPSNRWGVITAENQLGDKNGQKITSPATTMGTTVPTQAPAVPQNNTPNPCKMPVSLTLYRFLRRLRVLAGLL
jgi:hypothetical protein